jgi:hypothetical protein
MEIEIRIKRNGTIVTEVIDRGTEECGNVKQENIGPECDRVEEVVT